MMCILDPMALSTNSKGNSVTTPPGPVGAPAAPTPG